jgi:hypothetical protein
VICSSQGLYLNTGQHKHRINIYTHQISMPCVGFKSTIPASERAKTVHASDRPATVIGNSTHLPPLKQIGMHNEPGNWHSLRGLLILNPEDISCVLLRNTDIHLPGYNTASHSSQHRYLQHRDNLKLNARRRRLYVRCTGFNDTMGNLKMW